MFLLLLSGLVACDGSSSSSSQQVNIDPPLEEEITEPPEEPQEVLPPYYQAIMGDLLIEADYWQDEPAILAAGLGFTGINGIPGLGEDGQTLEESEALARSAGAGWHDVSSPSMLHWMIQCRSLMTPMSNRE
tara:strand:- start:40650 stop:41045 length:396 start_codon:yes stop_codon:yes gene_type:complete